jgi:hypothetical protein
MWPRSPLKKLYVQNKTGNKSFMGRYTMSTGKVTGVQWRTEGVGVGFGGFKPSPKFRSFEKAEPNSLFRGKYIRNCLVFLFHHPN